MNCSDVQARLSAYYDGELSGDVADEVATHLARCSSCAAELAAFEQLSSLTRKLTDPPIPTDLWEELQVKLGEGQERTPITDRLKPVASQHRLLALAASILIAVGIGVIAYQFSFPPHDQLAANFGAFLNEFADRPDQAQRFLLASYDGRPTSLQEASASLGYQPIAAKGLPPGYTFENAYVLTMPCCTCTEVVCRYRDGGSIAIFEHDTEQPAWFGDRPATKCICDNVPTNVVQIGDMLAASWKNGSRYITIIGARDLDEVTSFVTHLNRADTREG